ncbi:MAG: methyl-accepting chemotaxis protein, partial [Clostridiales bacterium]|nr:methyl-accepting chemotaxis protein [Clostridiales bacterium]
MKWFYNLKLATKIAALSTILLISILVTGIVGVINVSNENKLLSSLYEDGMGHTIILLEAKSYLQDVRLAVRSHISTTNMSAKKSFEESIAKSEQSVENHLKELSGAHLTDWERKELESLNSAYESYKSSKNVTIRYSSELKMNEAFNNADGDAKTKYESVVKSFDSLVQEQLDEAAELYTNSEKTTRNSLIIFISVIAASILIGIILSIIIIRAVVKPVLKVTTSLNEIAQSGGDLTKRIGLQGKDEMGQLSSAFDLFISKLQGIISEVAQSAQTMASSSQQLSSATSESNKALEQIAVTVNSIASDTSESVAVFEQTTASLSEAVKFSESTAEASRKTNKNSVAVTAAAEQGSVLVNEVVTTIQNIANSLKVFTVLINDLGDSSKKIGDIVRLITNISEQTNLLALNAAIEAARAGE